MNNEQIFLSYSRENLTQVKEINSKIKDEGFNTWMDIQNAFPGYEFMDFIPKAINESELFIIFFSKERKETGFFNLELEHIRDKYKSIRPSDSKPRVIVVLLDPPDRLDIDYWLNNFTRIDYFKNKAAAYKQLSGALHIWALHYKIRPSYISDLAVNKLSQEPDSKRLLARWVKDYINKNWKDQSILLGCGTTIYDLWLHQLRDYFSRQSFAQRNLFTINDFIIHKERESEKSGFPSVQINQVGNIHEKHYAAYRFERPDRDLPHFNAAIISVAGFRIEENELNLNVCWESLVPMLEEIFNKVHNHILIVAAGRKLIEPEGSHFLNLFDLSNKDRKITIVIDDKVKASAQQTFKDTLELMDQRLGPSTRKSDTICWEIQR